MKATLAVTVVGASVLAWVLTACTPTVGVSPSPTIVGTGPTAIPTFQCTPEAGGSPSPCTQQAHDDMVAKDALYAEAEAVYRQFVAEDTKLLQTGGLAEGPVLDLIGGPLLAEYTKDKSEVHDLGITMTGSARVVYVRRAVSKSFESSDVALETCVDGTAMMGFRNGKRVGPGNAVAYTIYFKRTVSRLTIWWGDGAKVTAC